MEKKILPKVYSPDISTGNLWYIHWYEDGKRKKKYGNINTFSTFEGRMKAAKALIRKIKKEKESIVPVKDRAYQYITNNRKFWRKKTYQTVKSKLDCFYKFFGKEKLTKEGIKLFFNWLKQNRSKTTYDDYRRKLKMVFREIGEEHLFQDIKKIKFTMTPARYFQRYQVKRLKSIFQKEDPELWLFVQFQYYCFIRPNSELRLLRAGDVQLDDNRILIRATISKNNKQQYVSIPKPFREQLQFIKEMVPNEFIFHKAENPQQPYSYNYFGRKHRKILKASGFDNSYKLYSWKHTGAVACIKAGINVKELQIQLRHSSLEEVDRYLRQLGVADLENLENNFPEI